MTRDQFELVSIWRLDAPLAQVWRVLTDAEGWPAWWSFVETVERLEAGAPDGVGSLWRHEWKTMLPYCLRFRLRIVRIEAPRLLEAEVSGDLEGRGICRLEPVGRGTALRYEWNVCACKPWMRFLTPMMRPLFLWNHRMVMQRGERQLAAHLRSNARAETCAACR